LNGLKNRFEYKNKIMIMRLYRGLVQCLSSYYSLNWRNR